MLGDKVETLPELALRFCLSAPEVSTVISGMRRPAHVRQNTLASTKGSLAPGMLAKLKPHPYTRTGILTRARSTSVRSCHSPRMRAIVRRG